MKLLGKERQSFNFLKEEKINLFFLTKTSLMQLKIKS